MIFVTIGSVFPFDRLVRAMDGVAAGTDDPVRAQIGQGAYEPRHMQWDRTLDEHAFAQTVAEAAIVVAHAGMGSAITALREATPIVLMPRRVEDGEHTTDHQIATAKWLARKTGVVVAWDESELPAAIQKARALVGTLDPLDAVAPPAFTDRIAAQLDDWLG